jgi:hypothetical protein
MQAQGKFGDNPKVPSTPTQRPEEVGIFMLAGERQ